MASVSFPHQHDWVQPRLSGLTALRLLAIPEPDQGAGEREILPRLCVVRAPGPVGLSGHWVRAQLHTFCGCGPPVSVFWGWGGGMCVPSAPALSAGQGSPTLRLLGESVDRVTCGLWCS